MSSLESAIPGFDRRSVLLRTMWVAALLLLYAVVAMAAKKTPLRSAPRERVISLDARMMVNPDTSMRVVETIQVQTAGITIQRFFNRDILTTYSDDLGNKLTIRLDVVSVERDGNPESYHVDPQGAGVRISCGDTGRAIPPGAHTYVLTYDVGRQIDFLADLDEFFWNVTGTSWAIPVDVATATVVLPAASTDKSISLNGYTGTPANQSKNFVSAHDSDGNPIFHAEHLPPHQGLTIIVSWQKGLLAPPSQRKQWVWFLKDHGALLTGMLGLAAILAYYIVAWTKVGRDPRPGTIMPSSSPPEDLSPAAMRYLEQMQFDDRAFAASILNLAAKGYITVEREMHGYKLVRRENVDDAVEKALSPDERMLARKLFEAGNVLPLMPEQHRIIQQARRALELSLHTRMEGAYFLTNARYLWPGIIMTMGTIAAVAVMGSGGFTIGRALFMTVLLTLCTMAVSVLLAVVYKAWKSAATSAFIGMAGAIILTLICLPLLATEGIGAYMLWESGSPATFFLVCAVLASNVLFQYLLKRPTSAGRKLLDRIEGFKLFLNGVQAAPQARERIVLTASLYERLLPYALALEVEDRWTEQFLDVLVPSSSSIDGIYAPSWYAGAGFVLLAPNAMTLSFGMSFVSALVSAAEGQSSASESNAGDAKGSESEATKPPDSHP